MGYYRPVAVAAVLSETRLLLNKKKINGILDHHASGSFIIADVGAMGRLECLRGFENRSELHAFEPNPQEMALLKKKYANHSFKNLIFSECALGAEDTEIPLLINNKASMSSFLKADYDNYKKHFGHDEEYPTWEKAIRPEKELKVCQRTADSYFGDAVIDLMKIDTQGSELDVLRGAVELVKERRIGVLKIEVSTIPVYKKQVLFSDIDHHLREFGYSLVDLITYHNAPLLFFSRKSRKRHSTACGDAIYVCDDINRTKSQLIKTGVVLASFGYKSVTQHFLCSAGLSNEECKEILSISDHSTAEMLKFSLKALLPPLIFVWIKRLYEALKNQ